MKRILYLSCLFVLCWVCLVHAGAVAPLINPTFWSLKVDTSGISGKIVASANNTKIRFLMIPNSPSTGDTVRLEFDAATAKGILYGVDSVLGPGGSTDSLFIFFRGDQADSCTYMFYKRSDSTFNLKPCGKAAFAIGSGSGSGTFSDTSTVVANARGGSDVLKWRGTDTLQISTADNDTLLIIFGTNKTIVKSASSADTLVGRFNQIGDISALGAIDIYGMLRLRLNGVSGKYGFDTTVTPFDKAVFKFRASDSLFHLGLDSVGAGGSGDDTVAYVDADGGTTLERPYFDVFNAGALVDTFTYLTDSTKALLWTDSSLQIMGKQGTAVGDTSVDAAPAVIFADTLRPEADKTAWLGLPGTRWRMLNLYDFDLYTGSNSGGAYDTTDIPTNGQVLTWATGGVINWQSPGAGTGTGDTLIVNVAGVEYSIVSNRIKTAEGLYINYRRDDSTAFDKWWIDIDTTAATGLNGIYVKRDGTTPMTADWNAGGFEITNIEKVVTDTIVSFQYITTDHPTDDDTIEIFTGNGLYETAGNDLAVLTGEGLVISVDSVELDTTAANIRALVIEHIDDSLNEYALSSTVDDYTVKIDSAGNGSNIVTKATDIILQEGSNITFTVDNDTLTITGSAGGSDNDTSKVLADLGGGAIDKKLEWATSNLWMTDITANAQPLIFGSNTDFLNIRADSGLAIGDTSVDARPIVLFGDTVRPEDDRVTMLGTTAFEWKRVNSGSVNTDTLLDVDSSDILAYRDGTVDQTDIPAEELGPTRIKDDSVYNIHLGGTDGAATFLSVVSTMWAANTNGTIDLGGSSNQWRDLYVDRNVVGVDSGGIANHTDNSVDENDIDYPSHGYTPEYFYTAPKAAADSIRALLPIWNRSSSDATGRWGWQVSDTCYAVTSTTRIADTQIAAFNLGPFDNNLDSLVIQVDSMLSRADSTDGDSSQIVTVKLYSCPARAVSGAGVPSLTLDTTLASLGLGANSKDTIPQYYMFNLTAATNRGNADPGELYEVMVITTLGEQNRVHYNLWLYLND